VPDYGAPDRAERRRARQARYEQMARLATRLTAPSAAVPGRRAMSRWLGWLDERETSDRRQGESRG